MRKKYTLVLWHAVVLVACLLWASHTGYNGKIPCMVAGWGLLHGLEFLFFTHQYRYLSRFKDYVPVHAGWYSGFLIIKLTSFMHFEFYRLFGGEVRVWCRHNNRRYTVFHPNWL